LDYAITDFLMITFKGVMKSIEDSVEQDPQYFIVVIPANVQVQMLSEGVIQEGVWKHDNKSGFDYRKDQPHTSPGEYHIHICDPKHHSAKDRQAAWNASGTRHDKGSFYDDLPRRKDAEELARRILKLPDNVVLEVVRPVTAKKLLTEALDQLRFAEVLVLRAKKKLENSKRSLLR
jgi:hypothetical protein